MAQDEPRHLVVRVEDGPVLVDEHLLPELSLADRVVLGLVESAFRGLPKFTLWQQYAALVGGSR